MSILDTIPGRRGRIPVNRKDGSRTYVKGSVCDFCTCNSKEQATCVFQRENVQGIKAAFSPKTNYRRKHRDDISVSPLMQQFKTLKPIDWRVDLGPQVLPEVKLPYFPVKGWNGMMSTLKKLQVARKQIVG